MMTPRAFVVSVPVLALALVVLVGATTPMMFVQPQALPAKRIIANLEARLKKTPDDHHLTYTLARVHYLSFVNRSELIPGHGTAESGRPAQRHLARGFLAQKRYSRAREQAMKAMGLEPTTPLDAAQRKEFNSRLTQAYDKLVAAKWVPKPLSRAALLEAGRAAMTSFDKAVNLAPEVALYHLGRASLGEQVLHLVKDGKLDKPFPGVSAESVAKLYFKTFELALKKDLDLESVPIAGLQDLVSHESGTAYLRLIKRKKPTAKEKANVAAVRKGLAGLQKLRRGPITPILIGSVPRSTLGEMLDADRTVWFDLDGDGVRESWPWVRPDTGILVWAPVGSKRIESGRQLFGSVTFFLFHRDGYAALALLDDDQDGELRDLELDGLAIWYDRNGDAISDPGELVSVFAAGVKAIATRPTGFDGRAQRHASGLRYLDGRVVPTVDWITERR
jgi:hypothetical protein